MFFSLTPQKTQKFFYDLIFLVSVKWNIKHHFFMTFVVSMNNFSI